MGRHTNGIMTHNCKGLWKIQLYVQSITDIGTLGSYFRHTFIIG